MRLPRKLLLLVLFSDFAETTAYLSTSFSSDDSSRHSTTMSRQRLRRKSNARDDEDGGIHDSARSFSDNLPTTNSVLSRSSFFKASAVAIGALAVSAASTPQAQAADTAAEQRITKTTTTPITPQETSNSLYENKLALAAEESNNSVQESISGFVAGGALAATKTLVKYPLDTVTVRLQVPNSNYAVSDIARLFGGSYNGVTLSLLSNIPGGAVFFAVKDAAKASLKSAAWTNVAPKWVTTTMAVGAALLPYWIVRNPSEVIKVRQQAGVPGYGEGVSAWDAIQLTLNETSSGDDSGGSLTHLNGIQTLYTGYWENVIYGLPADVIKFVAYEAFTGGRKDLSPLEGARAGAFATATAQLVTTPLDVIRNRLMVTGTAEGARQTTATTNSDYDSAQQVSHGQKNYIQSLIALGKEEGLEGLFAGAIPRVAKAFLSGAIQFATYEETKQSVSRLLQKRSSK